MNQIEINKIEGISEKIKKEGNEMKFEALGMECLIKRHPTSGHWCGYVQVPKDTRLGRSNRYYYSSDSELGVSPFEQAVNDIDVHGGITYLGELGWGFDCAHAGDLSPYFERYGIIDGEVYRDKKYVIEECKNLARQLKKIIETYK